MSRLIKIHVIFLVIAMFIAFALVPLDRMYFSHQAAEKINQYYHDAFNFKSERGLENCFHVVFRLILRQVNVKSFNKIIKFD